MPLGLPLPREMELSPLTLAAMSESTVCARVVDVLIVGAGLAGVNVALALRQQGFTGSIEMLGSETELPYDRPPLTKKFDAQAGPPQPQLLLSGDRLAQLDITMTLGVPATGLDAARGCVFTQQGEKTASVIVVATGAAPVILPSAANKPVYPVTTIAQARALHAALQQHAAARVVIVGGSWLALELASALQSQVGDIVVVERESQLLPTLPGEVGRLVRSWLEQAGIAVKLGVQVQDLSVQSTGEVVVHTSDAEIVGDVVISALGVRSATGWLGESELSLDPGSGAVRVRAQLQSSAGGVFALGDASTMYSSRYQTWLPGGHWQQALDASSVVAANVMDALNQQRPRQRFDPVPYLFSEMFGRTLQFAGYLPQPHAVSMITRGDVSSSQWSMAWFDDDNRLQAVLGCNAPRDVNQARKLMQADPEGTPLVDLAAWQTAARLSPEVLVSP